MKDMIGFCGLDCEKCDAYLATIHNDQALRENQQRERGCKQFFHNASSVKYVRKYRGYPRAGCHRPNPRWIFSPLR